MAKKSKLEGPINLAKDPVAKFRTYTPTIQLKLSDVRVGPNGIKTKTEVSAKALGLWARCSGAGGYAGANILEPEVGALVRKNGTFSLSQQNHNNPGSMFSITGRIPRKGTATGTIREVNEVPFSGPGEAYGTCDTGVLSWTATRTKQLTSSQDLLSPPAS